MTFLHLLADALGMVGIALAGHGYWRTWAQFGTGDPLPRALVRHTWGNLGKVCRGVVTVALKRLHLHGSDQYRVLGTARGGGRLRGGVAVVTYTPPELPSITDDPEAFAKAVQERLERARRRTARLSGAIKQERRDRSRDVEYIRRDMAVQQEELSKLTRSVAVDGLYEALCGWLCLALAAALTIGTDVAQAIA